MPQDPSDDSRHTAVPARGPGAEHIDDFADRLLKAPDALVASLRQP